HPSGLPTFRPGLHPSSFILHPSSFILPAFILPDVSDVGDHRITPACVGAHDVLDHADLLCGLPE
ncbi:MAG: hypothetical protein ACXW28_03380, partial [Thermoanaerobaculia bacterium]